MNNTNGIVRRDPFAAVVPLDRVFTRFFGNDPFFSGMTHDDEASVEPLAIDLADTGEAFEVHASLPGFAKEDVDISVDDNVLTIRASRREESEENQRNFLRRERRLASVSRQVRLPAPVNDEGASAELRDGVLTLRLPKAEDVRPRRISVN